MKKEFSIWTLKETTNKNEELARHSYDPFILSGSIGKPLKMCNVEFPTKTTFTWTTTDIVTRYEDANGVVVETANSTYRFKREFSISRSMFEELENHISRESQETDHAGNVMERDVDYVYNNVLVTLRYFRATDEYGVPYICERPEVAWISINGEKRYSVDDVDDLELLRLFSYLHNGEDIEKHLHEFNCVYIYATNSYVK